MSEAPQAPVKRKRKIVLDERLQAYKGVWVVIEQARGQVHPVSLELLGEGRKLADSLGTELSGVVLCAPGTDGPALCREAFEHGADLCYLMQSEVLKAYRNVPFTQGLSELVNVYQPEILLLGATTQGRDLAGSVATALATGLTADCTGLAIDLENRSLLSTRPTFGGSLLCTIVTLSCRPQMATVRPRVMAMPARTPGRSGRVVAHPLALKEDDVITKVLAFIADDTRDKPQLPYADIIVAGGRGLGSRENFRLVWDLARVLCAEVGGSRPVVQAGWLDLDRQVGQSGKTVRPKLYIAAGISGAIQHRVGMEGADCIVAINNDPGAPIFGFAHLGVVADCVRFLPVLTDAFRQKLAQMKRAG